MVDGQETKKEIEALIASDKAMTPEERRALREQQRRSMYRRQLEALLAGLDDGLPECLMASYAHHSYQVACSIWTDDIARILREEFIEDVRRHTKRCLMCGVDLPLPYDEFGYCQECSKEIDELDA